MLKRTSFMEKIIRRMISLSTDSSAEFINQDIILTIPITKTFYECFENRQHRPGHPAPSILKRKLPPTHLVASYYVKDEDRVTGVPKDQDASLFLRQKT